MTATSSILPAYNAPMKLPVASGLCSAATCEQQFGESQAYFAALLQSSIDAIVIIDERGCVVEFNPAAESMFGHARDHAIGRKLSELVIPAALRERHETGFRRYVETDSSPIVGQCIEMPAVRADGTEFPVELSVMGSTQGGRRLFTAFIRDLTKRKLAALNHERLNVIVEASEDAVISQDLEGTILTWNRAAERLFGYSAQETIGRSIAFIVPLSHQQELANNLVRIRRGERIRDLETVRLHKDGHQFDVSLRISPIRDGQGHVIGVSKIAKSITERKWLETRLRLEQRALEQVAEGIFFTDPTLPDNPVVYVNPAFERITGYKSVDIQGRNWEILNGPNEDHLMLKRIQQAIQNSEPCTAELLNYRASGETFWGSLSITPLFDFAGRVTHFVGVLSDITRRRALEEQLRQSQKMDALGRLAGGIAHDFNNILTVILGNTELALDELPSDNRRLTDLIHEVGEAARRAAELTKQVLVFSRKQAVEPKCLSLNRIITSLDKLLGRLIGADVELAIKLSSNLGWIKADAGQLEQVLMNLAVNARDAMPNGGTLIIETTNLDFNYGLTAAFPELPPGSYVKLSVTDSGCGMSADVLSRVFEPFFTTKLPGQGTGMGLATVFGIVKQSGGHDLLITDVIMPSTNGRELADELRKSESQCKTLFISGYALDGLVKRGILPVGAPFLQKPFDQSALTSKVRKLLDST